MICDVIYSLLFLIKKLAFFNKQYQGFILCLMLAGLLIRCITLFRSSFVTPLSCTEVLTPFWELLKICFHLFVLFVICEVMAYLVVRVLRFVVLCFDCLSDSLILKLVFIFVFSFLYNYFYYFVLLLDVFLYQTFFSELLVAFVTSQ